MFSVRYEPTLDLTYSYLMLLFKVLACSCICPKPVPKDQRVIHPRESYHSHLHPLYPTISQRPRFHIWLPCVTSDDNFRTAVDLVKCCYLYTTPPRRMYRAQLCASSICNFISPVAAVTGVVEGVWGVVVWIPTGARFFVSYFSCLCVCTFGARKRKIKCHNTSC